MASKDRGESVCMRNVLYSELTFTLRRTAIRWRQTYTIWSRIVMNRNLESWMVKDTEHHDHHMREIISRDFVGWVPPVPPPKTQTRLKFLCSQNTFSHALNTTNWILKKKSQWLLNFQPISSLGKPPFLQNDKRESLNTKAKQVIQIKILAELVHLI